MNDISLFLGLKNGIFAYRPSVMKCFRFGGRMMSPLEFLKNEIETKNSLEELISVFERMCDIPIDAEDEMILFETGTYSFTGKPMFMFSLVRQYPNEEEEYYQIHLDIMFEPTLENSAFQQATWSDELEENIFAYIRESQEYLLLKQCVITEIEVYIDET